MVDGGCVKAARFKVEVDGDGDVEVDDDVGVDAKEMNKVFVGLVELTSGGWGVDFRRMGS